MGYIKSQTLVSTWRFLALFAAQCMDPLEFSFGRGSLDSTGLQIQSAFSCVNFMRHLLSVLDGLFPGRFPICQTVERRQAGHVPVCNEGPAVGP